MSGNFWMILGAVVILGGTLLIQHGASLNSKKSQEETKNQIIDSENNVTSHVVESKKKIVEQTLDSEGKIHSQIKETEKNIIEKIEEVNESDSDFARSKVTKKTIQQQKTELSDAISLLGNAINGFEKGESQYLKIISGQLRALVCSGHKTSNPLFLNLSEELGVKLECFGFRADYEDKENSLNEGLIFSSNLGPVISIADFPCGQKFDFKVWLEVPILIINEYKYNPNELISLVSEIEGGSTYSDEIPEKLSIIKNIKYQKGGKEFSEVENILIQIAHYVIHYSKIVIQKNI